MDRVSLSDVPPKPLKRPVWGFADLHTHPLLQQAFGGLYGKAPSGAVSADATKTTAPTRC